MDTRAIRRIVLEHSHRARTGHIGSSLSVVEIVAAVLEVGNPGDKFILSKGHAALAMYAALNVRGILCDDALRSYCADGSCLGDHPEFGAPGVCFATGSLGYGLSMGCGAAVAARMQRSHRRVFVLMSDAECNEGSVWEAASFAAHHKLGNLTAVIDLNGQQALGRTKTVLDMSNMAARWSSFGWKASESDGHDVESVSKFLAQTRADAPTLVVAHTVSGKGVSFMEDRTEWHYRSTTDSEHVRALEEVAAR